MRLNPFKQSEIEVEDFDSLNEAEIAANILNLDRNNSSILSDTDEKHHQNHKLTYANKELEFSTISLMQDKSIVVGRNSQISSISSLSKKSK